MTITALPCAPRRKLTPEDRETNERWHTAVYDGSLCAYLRAHSTFFKLDRPKRRQPPSYGVKLTPEKVLDIRQELKRGASPFALAEHYGVSYKTVWEIKIRRTWKGVK